MNKFRIIFFSILSAALLTAVSCNKEGDKMGNGEGSISFRYDMGSVTKAVLTDEEAITKLEAYILKIYSYSEAVDNGDGTTTDATWELIRYYSPAYEVPDAIYLNPGKYKATISMQVDYVPTTATTDSNEFLYYGEEEFTIEAGVSSDVAIECNVTNSVVKLVYNFDGIKGATFDGSSVTYGEETLIKEIVSYVSISDEFSFDDVENVPTVKYNNSGDNGYFVCQEGEKLSWGVTYKHSEKLNEEFKDIAISGGIENPKPSTLYVVNLNYSESAGGFVDLNIVIDQESIEGVDDSFIFSPQPTIAGSGISTPFTYIDGVTSYSIASLKSLNEISIERDGAVITAYANGAVVEGVKGVESVEISEDGKRGTLTLNGDFFAEFINGGEQKFKVTATDQSLSVGSETMSVNVTGMLSQLENADYWYNTGTFKAFITNPNAESVKMYVRRKGTEDWYEYNAVGGNSGSVYSASITPVWAASKNTKGLEVNTLSLGVTVGGSYECRVEVDGVQLGGIAEVTTGGSKQSIPYANLESSGLSCFGTSNESSSNWASGNNTFTKSLCTQATRGGSSTAKLLATEAAGTFAAGNLIFGQFKFNGIIEQTGTVRFGQPFDWSARPRALKLKYSAQLATMGENYGDGLLVKGEPDKARVYMCIVDWGSRHEVTSGSGSPTGTWDPENVNSLGEGEIIGYASQFITASTSNDMHDMEIPVLYYNTNKKPSKSITLVISAVTSAYGDYLVGAKGSVLYVDDFEFVY